MTRKGDKEALERIPQTTDVKLRAEVAAMCVATLKLSVPTVIDKEDNKVNAIYAGWPDRMYVVGKDGKIAYMGGPGPWGFKPNEVENWLKQNFPTPMIQPK